MPTQQSPDSTPPIVLSVAGFDPSGGGGLLADARACHAQGALFIGVQTALVPQNTQGVKSIEAVPPAVIQAQFEALIEDIQIQAVKIGLIPNHAVLEAALPYLKWCWEKGIPLVIDPVFAPTAGPAFSDDTTIQAVKQLLFPLATVITPNALEAEILSGLTVNDLETMEAAARNLFASSGAKNVLVKGGHVAPQTGLVRDVFFDGINLTRLSAPLQPGSEVRGTGCQLASALAAQLAWGQPPLEAARRAKDWLTREIQHARAIGGGRRVTTGLVRDFSDASR